MSGTIGTGTVGSGTIASPTLFEGIEEPSPSGSAYKWMPTLAEVGSLIRARTRIRGGAELGTFTSETRATGVEVEALILQACRRVATEVGREPCKTELRNDAKAAAALYAAMLVEQSYWPDQTTSAGSSFGRLEKLWNTQIATLREAVAENCGGLGEEGESGAAAPEPSARGNFDDGLPMYGRTWPPT